MLGDEGSAGLPGDPGEIGAKVYSCILRFKLSIYDYPFLVFTQGVKGEKGFDGDVGSAGEMGLKVRCMQD